jgi:GntR family transcriptional regulator
MSKPFELKVDPRSAVPVYEQIKSFFKLKILSGEWADGDQLMSIRELAVKLRINPNTIIKVYNQLETEGFLLSRQGSGHFVKRPDPAQMREEKRELFKRLTDDYMAKALEIGFGAEEMLAEISGKAGRKKS